MKQAIFLESVSRTYLFVHKDKHLCDYVSFFILLHWIYSYNVRKDQIHMNQTFAFEIIKTHYDQYE